MSYEYRSVDILGPEHQGHRVTVRRRLQEGGYSDVVGVLEHIDTSSVTVRTHRGDKVVIPQSEIAAARVIEAPPLKNPANPAPG
jgi:ribosome maturation factor RimP